VTRATEHPVLDDDLLAALSHELRTPVANIMGYAELLTTDGPDLDPDTRRMLQAIRRNADRQAHVLENLTVLADIRCGWLPPGTDRVDLAEVLAALPGQLGEALAHWDVGLEIDTAHAAPGVRGDAAQLRHALAELVLAMAGRTEAGGVVSVVAEARPGSALVTIASPSSGPDSRGLHGVGVAVALAVLDGHGGRVTVGRGGAGVQVELPAG
jgi:signal transduction histidine kinase